MIQVNFNEEADSVAEGLNLSIFRKLALEDDMREILETFRSGWQSMEITSTAFVLKGFLALAQNDKELVYVAYCAGEKLTKFMREKEDEADDLADFFEDED